jgi:hypothetical protein
MMPGKDLGGGRRLAHHAPPKRPPQHGFGAKLGAAMELFSIHDRFDQSPGGASPLPDANLANIGGAIIRALGRRCRAKRNHRNQSRK